MADKKADEVEEVIEDQSDTESKETEEEPTLQKAYEIAKATQKGYTTQQQQLAAIRENLDAVVEALNANSGAQAGEDGYVTKADLRQILAEQQQIQQNTRSQADTYIQEALDGFHAEGLLKSKDDDDAFLNFALKLQERNLQKASIAWKEVQRARDEAKKGEITVKKQIRQEEGSKIGTSSKTGQAEQIGVDYRKMKRFDWFGGNL